MLALSAAQTALLAAVLDGFVPSAAQQGASLADICAALDVAAYMLRNDIAKGVVAKRQVVIQVAQVAPDLKLHPNGGG